MGLRDKLERLERRADKGTAVLLCQECGERVKVPADIALRLNVAAWLRRRAERRGEPVPTSDPAVSLIDAHPHDALVDVRTGNPPGLPRGW